MPNKALPDQILPAEAGSLRSLFEQYIERTKSSQEKFGQENDIGTQGAVWQYIHGKRPLNLSVAIKFANGIGCSVEDFSPRLAEELRAGQRALRTGMGDMGQYNVEGSPIPIRTGRVPVVGTAQAGDDGYWLEIDYPTGHGDGFVHYPMKDRNSYALRIKGDSMRPRYKPGEFVIIEPNTPIATGDEVLVKTKNGRSMVKVLHTRRGGLVELLSINDDHKPITLDEADIELMHYVAGYVKANVYYAVE